MLSDSCYSYTEATVQECLDELLALFPASIKYAVAKNRDIVIHLKLSSKAADFEEWAMPYSKPLGVKVKNDKTSFGMTKGKKRGKEFKGAWPLVWITPPHEFTDAQIKSYFDLIHTWPDFQIKKLQQRHNNLYRKRISPEITM